jgi:hypothetical protein
MSVKKPRAPTAYNLFVKENYHDIRAEVQQLFPRQSAKEINKATIAELGKLWTEQKGTGRPFRRGPPPLPKKPTKIIRAEPSVREYFENLLEERKKAPKIHKKDRMLAEKDLQKYGPRIEQLLRESYE